MNTSNLPWILVILLLGWIVYAEFIRGPATIIKPGETEVTVIRDTIRTPADTIRVPGPVQYVEIPVPEPVMESDTVYLYVQEYEDSFLSATFRARTTGRLLSWDLTYRPFIHRVEISTTLLETRVITVPQYYHYRPETRTELLLGGGATSLGGIELAAGVSRGRYQYQYGYSVLDGGHRISMLRKFSF